MFRFYVNVAVNNAFQVYRQRQPDAGESKLDALEFRRAIVEACYLQYSTDMPQVLFPGSRSQPREHVRFECYKSLDCKGDAKTMCKTRML